MQDSIFVSKAPDRKARVVRLGSHAESKMPNPDGPGWDGPYNALGFWKGGRRWTRVSTVLYLSIGIPTVITWSRAKSRAAEVRVGQQKQEILGRLAVPVDALHWRAFLFLLIVERVLRKATPVTPWCGQDTRTSGTGMKPG